MDAAFGFTHGFQIKVLGVPMQNARSRVETQTKLCLQMVDAAGNKTSTWSHLRLPELLVTKEKLRKNQAVVDYSLIPNSKVLDVQAVVLCASDPSKHVQICSGCQLRESKRGKKKSDTSGDIKVEEGGGDSPENEAAKIVLFNCGSYVDFSSGDTILPTRITCYCRHHNEKIGFCVYFIARDHNSSIVATGISPPILITDDHKGTKNKMPSVTQTSAATPQLEPDSDFRRTKKVYQSPPPAQLAPAPPTAVINRIIPGEGPIQGGVEVTILGDHMHNGLIAVFGDMEAVTTQVWGTSTMICILPPSSSPGPVPVTLKSIPGLSTDSSAVPGSPEIPCTFLYKDDLDRSLMELALQVVGLRMTGSLDSARNIAMRIVNETAQETMNDSALTFNELKRNQLETAVINAFLSLEAHSNELDTVVLTSLLDMTFHSGGLNLLHLAAYSGMTTLVKYLLSMDCDVNPRDKNGYTPLMVAIHAGNTAIVRILLQGAAFWFSILAVRN
ncbi:hypothetical protein BJ741DRAFT_536994 [Chytriomyces cf. hyalinus JEL632]|nr:hypothetical protein BJ741DRAFT_536994 [Chytriomyces cf. hyalinus JEL632]